VYGISRPWTVRRRECSGRLSSSRGLGHNYTVLFQFDNHFHDLCLKRSTYTSGEHLEGDFGDAGFVDIQVKRKVIDVGDWRNPGGFMLNPLIRGGNTEQNAAARLAISVWGGAFTVLVDRLKHVYPDDEKRASFGQRVVADLKNPDYHLYSIAYVFLGKLLNG
jgi:hypothetical protein